MVVQSSVKPSTVPSQSSSSPLHSSAPLMPVRPTSPGAVAAGMQVSMPTVQSPTSVPHGCDVLVALASQSPSTPLHSSTGWQALQSAGAVDQVVAVPSMRCRSRRSAAALVVVDRVAGQVELVGRAHVDTMSRQVLNSPSVHGVPFGESSSIRPCSRRPLHFSKRIESWMMLPSAIDRVALPVA
jgi:hypothetical protein